MLLFALVPAAYALTCEEVTRMVDVNVPSALVVQMVEESGEAFSDSDLRCLAFAGVPREVLEAAAKSTGLARGGQAEPTAVEEPLPAAEPPLPECTVRPPNKRVFELLKSPAREPEDHYELGLCLRTMGLLHTAQFHFIEALKAGPADRYFPLALAGLVELAGMTGDASDLARIAAKVPPESFPASVRSELSYQLGLRLYDQGNLVEARRRFDDVREGSLHYWNARFIVGVIYARGCPSRSAVRAFTEVLKGSPDRELRDRAQLEIGNIYYSIEQFGEAVAWFTLPPDSPQYVDSLLRLGWTQLRLGQAVTALDDVPRDAWLPEAEHLRALVATEGDSAAAVDTFEATYAPVAAQLRTILARYAADESAADEAFRLYGDQRTSALPPPLLAQVHRDRELQGILTHLALMDREEHLIRRQAKPWREGVGGHIVAVLAADRLRLQRRAGLILLRRLAWQEESLSGLLRDAQVLQ